MVQPFLFVVALLVISMMYTGYHGKALVTYDSCTVNSFNFIKHICQLQNGEECSKKYTQ